MNRALSIQDVTDRIRDTDLFDTALPRLVLLGLLHPSKTMSRCGAPELS